ncbi:MAG TPA: hypothetical protein PKI03_30890, partial [Pseudomonadota bacterium]|nr:hypothetical protein [Pseudomonadota bacterium]
MSDSGRDSRARGEVGSAEPAVANASRPPLADPHRPLLMDMLQAALADGGELSAELRRQAAANQGLPEALAGLVDKIAHHAYRVQDDDIQAIKRAGYS